MSTYEAQACIMIKENNFYCIDSLFPSQWKKLNVRDIYKDLERILRDIE